MYIKLKSIDTGVEHVFSTEEHHIALKVTPEELEAIQSMAVTDDGKALSGADHRTFACIRPVDDSEMEALSEWAKEP
ncbi:hypothetical protein [Pseudomonas asplenii]|uniref:hypothetical protein n=1 Tax=Pseudomonas asplenii TaxID=53407 RepID=UPI0003635112|nr:hypothetical protein [Pseudomonas fuscovaginae]